MGTRLEFHNKLVKLLGNNHVYYQPPESLKMEYPGIVYSRIDIDSKYADDIRYSSINCYNVIVIDRKPDNAVIQKILDLPRSSYDRQYIFNNLYHDVIKIYH